jgi:hypothetical protein
MKKQSKKKNVNRLIENWEPMQRSRFLQGWYLPDRIEIEDGNLIWIKREFIRSSQGVYPARRPRFLNPGRMRYLLYEFITLADADDNYILEYASHYGVLGICEHGVPSVHNPPALYPPLLSKPSGYSEYCQPTHCDPLRLDRDKLYEPLESWRQLSREFLTIVRLAVQLRDGKMGGIEEWKILHRLLYNTEKADYVNEGRIRISQAISAIIELCGVKPTLGYQKGMNFYLASHSSATGLPAALAVRLMLWANQSQGLALCANCGTIFELRKGQVGRSNYYCGSQDCLKIAARAASARYYSREKLNPNREKQEKKKLTEKQEQAICEHWEKWQRSNKPVMQFYLSYADKFSVSERTIRRVTKRLKELE